MAALCNFFSIDYFMLMLYVMYADSVAVLLYWQALDYCILHEMSHGQMGRCDISTVAVNWVNTV